MMVLDDNSSLILTVSANDASPITGTREDFIVNEDVNPHSPTFGPSVNSF